MWRENENLHIRLAKYDIENRQGHLDEQPTTLHLQYHVISTQMSVSYVEMKFGYLTLIYKLPCHPYKPARCPGVLMCPPGKTKCPGGHKYWIWEASLISFRLQHTQHSTHFIWYYLNQLMAHLLIISLQIQESIEFSTGETHTQLLTSLIWAAGGKSK